MPIWVDPEKCNGCYNASQPPCVRICPGDLIVKDMTVNKAYLKYTNDCWDCLPCVKVCPEEAIEIHLSSQFGPKGAWLTPHVDKKNDRIIWDLFDHAGNKETFTIKTKVLPFVQEDVVENEVSPVDFSI